MLNAAVALIIFNRPDTTEMVLAEIGKVKPRQLFVIADGPRPERSDDKVKCNAARALIHRVDWDCEIFKNYSEENLGCGHRPASGISWMFEHVESAIILEDDCVPDTSFFWYCDELLERYKNDYRIMQISGTNRKKDIKKENVSYTFSKFPIAFGGFATWRRAWHNYDFEMKLWPKLRNTPWLAYHLANNNGAEAYKKIFDFAYLNHRKGDFWDFQWIFALMVNNALSIFPHVNLHTNIGCREDGTHMTSSTHKYANIHFHAIKFPLVHPDFVIPDYDTDSFVVEDLISNQKGEAVSLKESLAKTIRKILPQKYRKEIKGLLNLICK